MIYLFLFIMSPIFLLWLAIILGVCFAIIYICKKALKIQKDEINNYKGSLVPLTFSVWAIDITAWLTSFIILIIVTNRIPFFNDMNSEWSFIRQGAGQQINIFIIMWTILYVAFILPSYFCFKKRITDRRKRNRMFQGFVIFTTIIEFLLYFVVAIFYTL